jgi:hypothetical protein
MVKRVGFVCHVLIKIERRINWNGDSYRMLADNP